jgi:hypothetical protein
MIKEKIIRPTCQPIWRARRWPKITLTGDEISLVSTGITSGGAGISGGCAGFSSGGRFRHKESGSFLFFTEETENSKML